MVEISAKDSKTGKQLRSAKAISFVANCVQVKTVGVTTCSYTLVYSTSTVAKTNHLLTL